MRIIIDTREQLPFLFQGARYEGVTTERLALQAGDYSLAGLTDKIAIERKSIDDLVNCLGRERERFTRELQRGAAYDFFAVLVEADWQSLAKGEYKSRFNPHSACQSVAALMARYGVPFVFAGSRKAAEYIAWSLLRQYLEGIRKRLAAILKAHDAEQDQKLTA